MTNDDLNTLIRVCRAVQTPSGLRLAIEMTHEAQLSTPEAKAVWRMLIGTVELQDQTEDVRNLYGDIRVLAGLG